MKRRRIPTAPIKGRLYFVFFIFVITLTVLGGRVYYFKTVKGAEYENRARNSRPTAMILWCLQTEALLWTGIISPLLSVPLYTM